MVDVDDLARDAGRGLRDSASRLDLPDMGAVRSSRHRRTGFAAAAGAFAVTLVVVGVATFGGGSAPVGTDATASPTTLDTTRTSDTTTETLSPSVAIVSVDGVELEVPSSWEIAAENLTPSYNDPLELVSLATFPLDANQGVCEPFPRQAVVDFPADGALITLRERFRNVDAASFIARPVAFGPEPPPYVLPEGDCLDSTSRGEIGTMRWFPFSQSGRYFELLVVIGSDALDWAVADTWEIVNSLVVEARDRQDPSQIDTIFAGNAFVIDTGGGPQVCGVVNTSLPPQCGGPPLVGLDWTAIAWSDSAQGVTWADMYIEVRIVDGALELVTGPTERRTMNPREQTFPPPPPGVDVIAIFEDIKSIHVLDWPAGLFWVSSFGPQEAEGTVGLSALIVTDEGQQWLDDRYGVGAVRATGMLQPIPTMSTGG